MTLPFMLEELNFHVVDHGFSGCGTSARRLIYNGACVQRVEFGFLGFQRAIGGFGTHSKARIASHGWTLKQRGWLPKLAIGQMTSRSTTIDHPKNRIEFLTQAVKSGA